MGITSSWTLSGDGIFEIEDSVKEVSLLKMEVCGSQLIVTEIIISLSVFVSIKSGSQTVVGKRLNSFIPLKLLSFKNTPLEYLSINRNIPSSIVDFPTLFAPAISVMGLILSSVKS